MEVMFVEECVVGVRGCDNCEGGKVRGCVFFRGR